MKKFITLINLFLLVTLAQLNSQESNHDYFSLLTPMPKQCYSKGKGIDSIYKIQKILYYNGYKKFADYLIEQLKLKIPGLIISSAPFSGTISEASILIGTTNENINEYINRIDNQMANFSRNSPGKEGYIIESTNNSIIIAGCDTLGLWNGVQTLIQILSTHQNDIKRFKIIDAPDLPNRWLYYPTNILVGQNITKSKNLWQEAVNNKLNGVLLADSKFAFISTQPKRYTDSLKSLKDFAEERYLNIIPGVMSFGYSNDMLFFNPNFATGLPVKEQKIIIESDTGRIVPSSNTKLPNPGFENYNGNIFTGFGFIDQPGVLSFADTQEHHSGKASIRFSGFEGKGYINARVNTRFKVKPYTQFHMGAWIKSENLTFSSQFQIMGIGNKGRTLCYISLDLPATTNGWKKYDITFNSLDADTVNIYWGVWGPETGKFWLDDLEFEEVGLINLIRRVGAPLNVYHPILDIAYKEGIDYDSLIDIKMGMAAGSWAGSFDSWHKPPVFRIRPGSNIKNGDTILLSYYHAVVIYDGQVMATTTDELLYYQIDREFKILDEILKPKGYFMNHDEIRTLNWDAGDIATGRNPAQLLADNVRKCTEIIYKYNNSAELWDWSDMFDEYHNAKLGKTNYYLVNGDIGGVADLIPKNINIMNWNFGKSNQSLNFFSDKGFSQMTAPFYDSDQNHIRISKESAMLINNFKGMMYTTWSSNYNYLEHFGWYAWNHAPFIYLTPPDSFMTNDKVDLDIEIEGDKWDNTWALTTAKLFFRSEPDSNFNSLDILPFLNNNLNGTISIKRPVSNKFQYYIEAEDNRNWKTRIPFDKNQFYFTRDFSTDISDKFYLNRNFKINTVITDNSELIINLNNIETNTAEISIYNVHGSEISNLVYNLSESNSTLKIDISHLFSGVYLIKTKIMNNVQYNKFIKI